MDTSWPPELIATRKTTGNADGARDIGASGSSSPTNPRHMLLSPDGTTILSSSVHQEKRTSTFDAIIIPPELLDGEHHVLQTFSALSLPEPIRAIAPYPYFELSDPASTLVLLSLPDHPIRLVNALALDSGIVASYPYVRAETEEVIAPHSLAFTPDAAHFLSGADNEVSLFDVHRLGQDALQRYKLRRHNQINQRGSWHLKRSIVSDMAISNDDVLAVGTFGREVGLFDRNGQGQMITSFDLAGECKGAGISQLTWSACGRYLLVGERKSDVIQVFDIRGQHRLLSTLTGRKANTMMKLAWDLTDEGDVWAGGTDGIMRTWKQVGMSEGVCIPSNSWTAHTDPVISTSIHRSGSVVITASAVDRNEQRQLNSADCGKIGKQDDSGTATSNSLAIWSLAARNNEALVIRHHDSNSLND